MYFDTKLKTFKQIEKDTVVNHLVGTAEYTAPEVLNNTIDNNYSQDLWALGCIIYKFFHGKTPFKGNSDIIIFDNILKRNFVIDSVNKY
jgi:3-phosphoinositide dependent protein kinase-1